MKLLFDENLSPKVVWIKKGNCSNRQIQLILRNKVEALEIFYQDANESFIRIR